MIIFSIDLWRPFANDPHSQVLTGSFFNICQYSPIKQYSPSPGLYLHAVRACQHPLAQMWSGLEPLPPRLTGRHVWHSTSTCYYPQTECEETWQLYWEMRTKPWKYGRSGRFSWCYFWYWFLYFKERLWVTIRHWSLPWRPTYSRYKLTIES